MIEEYSRVYATVNLDAIHSNVEHMKANMEPQVKMMGVIKTDGYGHGAIPIAKELEPLEYMYGFATATIEEAFILKQSGVKKPIVVLGHTFPYCYERMVQEEIRPTVFSYDMVKQLALVNAKWNEKEQKPHPGCEIRRTKVHIKVDTGMSRIGICPDEEGIRFVKQVISLPEIEIEGIYTHLARADEEDKTSAKKQVEVFQQFISQIKEVTGYDIPICHCSNSAGIIEIKEAGMNMVRAGIALYGLWPLEKNDMITLTPAMEIKSQIIFMKEVKPGTEISYGGTFVTDRQTKIATIPVGYGDGYPRGLSNKGYVLIRGQKAPILGRVCMDQFMVDVTDIKEVKEGDAVTLLGKDGVESITMEELGEISGRFNYELACCIGKRVPRVYIKSGKVVSTKDYFQDFK